MAENEAEARAAPLNPLTDSELAELDKEIRTVIAGSCSVKNLAGGGSAALLFHPDTMTVALKTLGYAPSLISDLRSARKLIPPVDHVEALRNQVLSLVDDLRSYARAWDWKYGETWDRERAEIAEVFEERIRLLSGEPAAQPPPDSSAALREARRLLGLAWEMDYRTLPGYRHGNEARQALSDEIRAFLGEQNGQD